MVQLPKGSLVRGHDKQVCAIYFPGGILYLLQYAYPHSDTGGKQNMECDILIPPDKIQNRWVFGYFFASFCHIQIL